MRRDDAIIKTVLLLVFTIVGIGILITAAIKTSWDMAACGLAFLLYLFWPVVVSAIISIFKKKRK